MVALLLDVDGVLNPSTSICGEDRVAVTAPGQPAFQLSPVLAGWIRTRFEQRFWVTDWMDEANVSMHWLLGRMPVLNGSPQDSTWWKADAVREWLSRNPSVDEVVWIDDELHVRSEAAQQIRMLMCARGGVLIEISPDPARGLARSHLDRVDDVLGRPRLPQRCARLGSGE